MRHVLALLATLFIFSFLADRSVAQDYRLQSGDTVRIEVLEDSTLNRDAVVLPDGQIFLPLTGSVQAAGRTLSQIQGDIAARLGPSFAEAPTVFVTLATLAPRVDRPARTIDVFIVGAANTPGQFAVRPGATILQAIAASGGLSPFAATKRIQIRRIDKSGNETIIPVNFDAIERGDSTGGTIRLSDGDVIVVPQRRLFE